MKHINNIKTSPLGTPSSAIVYHCNGCKLSTPQSTYTITIPNTTSLNQPLSINLPLQKPSNYIYFFLFFIFFNFFNLILYYHFLFFRTGPPYLGWVCS